MNMRFIFNRFILNRMGLPLWLLLWCIAVIVGILTATQSETVAVPLLLSVVSSRASFVSLLMISEIPVLITYLAFNRSQTLLLCFLILLTGISKGFVGMLIYLVYGSGAWLLRFLLLFTSSCSELLIWWLLMKHHKQMKQCSCQNCTFVAILMCFVSAFDAFVILPFISGLSI